MSATPKHPIIAPDARGAHSLHRLVGQLLDEARHRKRRVEIRLWDLRGDCIRYPVRGPMLPNGRPSPSWVFYQRAVSNHRRAARELNALLRILPNDQAEPLGPDRDSRNTPGQKEPKT